MLKVITAVFLATTGAICLDCLPSSNGAELLEASPAAQHATKPAVGDTKFNVLFIISDDLTATALSCYGNTICDTPNIDALAATGTRFTNAYCQGTYCGPSRASFMSGYYPHATGVLGYKNPRPQIGDRPTWSQHFKNNGYHAARVGKIFHMGVPGGVEYKGEGADYNGADDAASWTERFNTPGPEWMAAGDGETMEGNPDGRRPVVGGNTFVVVEADGGDEVHHDGKASAKAQELLRKNRDQPFWLGVGFVRPHVPFVAPRAYFPAFKPYDQLVLPPKIDGDWDDIPKPGINYKTSKNMQMNLRQQKKSLGGYLASVKFMDAQVGKVLQQLRESGLDDKTIVIFTSDHGYHLGEHDFWAKVSLRDESAEVPLIIRVPGKKPAVCDSFVELLDLYPTVASLCGLDAQPRLQGLDISAMLDDPSVEVRDAAFSVAPMRRGFLWREKKWSFVQYGEQAQNGTELFDVEADPGQYRNLAADREYEDVVTRMRQNIQRKLVEIRDNDLALQ
ncbi:MAG: sulfatase [Aureliella sp.]